MTQTNQALDAETLAVIQKVEKLMRLAGANPNEAEASSAMAKATELLAAYNLDLSVVEANSGDKGKRAEEKLEGGFYQFERDLWSRIAQLNFCFYWSQHTRTQDGLIKNKIVTRRQHRLVGRTVNIAATKAMAGYLLQTIERMTQERLRDNGNHVRSRWATSFREGMAQRIAEKIWDKRQAYLAQERREAEEAAKKAAAAGMAGASSGTGLALATFTKSEADANTDFIYGEGTAARWAADRARRAKAQAEAEAAYTAWAKAHPEEAAKKEAEERKRERARSSRYRGGSSGKEVDYGAYRAGYEKAEGVSIDLQAEGSKTAGALS